jgi:uncharacterized protein (TIGR03382 family)
VRSCLRSLVASWSIAFLLACGADRPSGRQDAAQPGKVAAVSHAAAGARAAVATQRPRLANLDVRSAESLRSSSAARAPAVAWAAKESTKLAAARSAASAPRDAVSAARAYLGLDFSTGTAAARAAVRGGAADETVVKAVHDLGRGPVVVQFQRKVGGLEVFDGRTSVVLSRDLAPVARTGATPSTSGSVPAPRAFNLDAVAAMAAAVGDVTGDAYAAGDLVTAASKGEYARADLSPATAAARGLKLIAPARARKVLFPLAGELAPAYRVEVALRRAGGPLLAFAYVISADDGSVLFRRNQVQDDSYHYRVWADPETFVPNDGPQGTAGTPHPTGLPDAIISEPVAQQLVTLQNYPFSQNDPWLPPASEVTLGNNVIAYADWDATDDYSDPYNTLGWTSDAATFDWGAYSYDVQPYWYEPEVYGAITQLFYVNNFLHDWYYDSGFDETAGNAQADNYGRGGLDGDPLHAEAQDFSGVSNANMFTPGDGNSPRMQMFLWTGNGPRYVQVIAPAAIAGKYGSQAADFGPSAFDLTETVVAAVPADGCSALTNGEALAGHIALVDRGGCYFDDKTAAAEAAGAAGVILRNVNTSQSFGPMGAGSGVTVGIPILMVAYDTGVALGAHLGEGITAQLYRPAVPYLDGTIDNLIVAHEWGHYLSNRLIDDGEGLDSNQSGGLGEGWGDTSALTLAVREEDAAVAANAGWAGTYGLGGWVTSGVGPLGQGTDGYYFGVRRVPYSTDMNKDPLTFRHIADGEALVPDGSTIPIAFGADGANNSEVHNTGEVWATMLWECYASLLRDTEGAAPRLTFAQAQGRWKDYLVAAFKATPRNPTLLEARDALLAVAYASDPHDYALFWQAFAKRGAGLGAVGPDKWLSQDNNPVVESYVAAPHFTALSSTFASAAGSCSDGDAFLDIGEAGNLTVVLRNDGTGTVGATTATPSATGAQLSFPGSAVSVPASSPGGTVTVTVPVAMSQASAATQATLVLTFPAASDMAGGTAEVPLVLNRDLSAPASSTIEDFTAATVPWTVDGTYEGRPGWEKVGTMMRGESTSHPSDLRLVSPPLTVSETAELKMTVFHRYLFESYPTAQVGPDEFGVSYDGGVIEISDDGGATWNDVADTVGTDFYKRTIEYPAPVGAVTVGDLYPGGANPLAGRTAFTFQNASYPGFDSFTLNLGKSFAGKTVQLRFRTGSDDYTGWGGWTLKWVSFDGITNSPFTVAATNLDGGKCAAKAGSKSGCSTGGDGLGAAALLALMALALQRRRRAS